MRPTLPLFACLLSCACASVLGDTFSAAIGMDYSSGDYGTGTTSEIWYIPVVGKYFRMIQNPRLPGGAQQLMHNLPRGGGKGKKPAPKEGDAPEEEPEGEGPGGEEPEGEEPEGEE